MRVRRVRTPQQEDAKPVIKARITRVRPQQSSPEPTNRVRRTRARPAPVLEWGSPIYGALRQPVTPYIIDWSWSWQKKFQLYLMTSYMYYEMHRSVISDHDYDKLCKQLLAGFDDNEHQHKHLITKDDLEATTGYAIKQYPGVVIGAAQFLAMNHVER